MFIVNHIDEVNMLEHELELIKADNKLEGSSVRVIFHHQGQTWTSKVELSKFIFEEPKSEKMCNLMQAYLDTWLNRFRALIKDN